MKRLLNKFSVKHRLFRMIMFAMSVVVPHFAKAQKGVFLAPQPHKLLYADTVYREAIAKKDTLLLAEAYYLYAKTYEGTGNLVLANQWFYKSLRILEPRGDSPALSRLYLRLSRYAYIQENYSECIRLTRKGMNMARRTKSDRYLGNAYGIMKTIHERDWSNGGKKPYLPKQRPDSAKYYLQKVLTIGEKTKDSTRIVDARLNLALYKWRNDMDTINLFKSFNTTINYYVRIEEHGLAFKTKIELAGVLLDFKKPGLALAQLNEAKQTYDSNPHYNDFEMLNSLQRTYSRYYRLTGNWKKAYEINESAHQLQITNYAADREGAVTRLGKEYDMEKKDILLKAKDTELTLRDNAFLAQQRFLIVSFILLIVLAGMSLIFYRLYKKNLLISQQNELLVKEQNHRVKNNLQAVSSLLSLQSHELSDPNALRAIEESRLRVETIGILHRKLYDGQRLAMVFIPDFLEELVNGVLNTYGLEHVETDFGIEDIYLSPDQAVHLGLIVNEVITNACKYAFPETSDPRLRLHCYIQKKIHENHLHLEIADNGPGLDGESYAKNIQVKTSGKSLFTERPDVMTPTRSGFGMKLISLETEQLYAKSSFHYDGGTVFKMDFTVDNA